LYIAKEKVSATRGGRKKGRGKLTGRNARDPEKRFWKGEKAGFQDNTVDVELPRGGGCAGNSEKPPPRSCKKAPQEKSKGSIMGKKMISGKS